METWRDIAGFEGYYQISDTGRVKSVERRIDIAPNRQQPKGYQRITRERILLPGLGEGGRQSVSLWKKHKLTQAQVHRLVLGAFVGPCPEGMEGCHGDGDAGNNRLANLRWDTPVNNNADKRRHGTHLQGSRLSWAVLKEEDIPIIRTAFAGGETQTAIAARYGVQQPAISRVLSGKSWAHVAAPSED